MAENINAQNPVVTFNLDKPMSWAEFHRLPEHGQIEYITKLRKQFGCGIGQMAEMFGTKKRDLITKAELLGLNISGARTARDPEKILAWEKFLGHEVITDSSPTAQNDGSEEVAPNPAEGEIEELREKVERNTVEALEQEIRGLERSPFVKLAKAETQIRQARIQYRDQLRTLESRGKTLVKQGWTFDMMEGLDDAEN